MKERDGRKSVEQRSRSRLSHVLPSTVHNLIIFSVYHIITNVLYSKYSPIRYYLCIDYSIQFSYTLFKYLYSMNTVS